MAPTGHRQGADRQVAEGEWSKVAPGMHNFPNISRRRLGREILARQSKILRQPDQAPRPWPNIDIGKPIRDA